ncbi:MAG: hypothetical protein KDE47_12680 [Caldilineaceae bacterium]|nr:hypothetical protein [Caldilineaceae bacterium]MCB0095383.1 hypothetical protein [Caldilineaceae bacterium]
MNNIPENDDFVKRLGVNGSSAMAEIIALSGESLTLANELKADDQAVTASDMLLTAGVHDEGNAQCTNARYAGRFAYNDALGWMHHTGTHWDVDGADLSVDRAIVDTLTARMSAALATGQGEQYEKLIKFCIPNKSRVQGAKYLLSSLAATSPSEFDNNPNLLNCANGVVDLRTGAITPHSPQQRFTHCVPVAYVPNANYDYWCNWLLDAVGSQEIVDWLQLAIGYSLTGHTSEEILFYLYGPPRAGKGLFTETLLALFGSPLAKEVNFGTFTAQRTGDSQNFDLAPLKAARLIAASESNSYERFNEAKVKALTGGNEVYCAFKHRTHFNYRPQFKIWLSSNQPPNADPDDDAVWGRLRVIEFPNSHLGKEDKSLKAQMRRAHVLEGVLAWAVEGAAKWYALGSSGLPEPESSTRLKAGYRAELDNVQAWLEERCEMGEGQFAPNSEIYPSYRNWCELNGIEPKKKKGLTQSLVRKGFSQDRTEKGRGMRGFHVSP